MTKKTFNGWTEVAVDNRLVGHVGRNEATGGWRVRLLNRPQYTTEYPSMRKASEALVDIVTGTHDNPDPSSGAGV